MRLTYGKVVGIHPSDGIYCAAQSTTQGILDKHNPGDYDFSFDEPTLRLIQNGDWGEYGDKGQLYVNFLTDNDITGGIGSPVLNARGELIGLAFDGNKESLASSYYFQEGCRNVSPSISGTYFGTWISFPVSLTCWMRFWLPGGSFVPSLFVGIRSG